MEEEKKMEDKKNKVTAKQEESKCELVEQKGSGHDSRRRLGGQKGERGGEAGRRAERRQGSGIHS